MRDHGKYEYALDILDDIDARKISTFAIAMIRDGRCAGVWFSKTSQSEEESIIERYLELGEYIDVDCVGLTWCKRHGKEALYTHALQACIDYIFPYVEKEKNRCRIAEDSNYN